MRGLLSVLALARLGAFSPTSSLNLSPADPSLVFAPPALQACAVPSPYTITSTPASVSASLAHDVLTVHVLRADDLLSDETPEHERALIAERLTHVVLEVKFDEEERALRVNDEKLYLGGLGGEGGDEPSQRVQVRAEALVLGEDNENDSRAVSADELADFAEQTLPRGLVSTEVSIVEDSTEAFDDVEEGSSLTIKSYSVFVKITKLESLELTRSTTVLVPVLKLELTLHHDPSGRPISFTAFQIGPHPHGSLPAVSIEEPDEDFEDSYLDELTYRDDEEGRKPEADHLCPPFPGPAPHEVEKGNGMGESPPLVVVALLVAVCLLRLSSTNALSRHRLRSADALPLLRSNTVRNTNTTAPRVRRLLPPSTLQRTSTASPLPLLSASAPLFHTSTTASTSTASRLSLVFLHIIAITTKKSTSVHSRLRSASASASTNVARTVPTRTKRKKITGDHGAWSASRRTTSTSSRTIVTRLSTATTTRRRRSTSRPHRKFRHRHAHRPWFFNRLVHLAHSPALALAWTGVELILFGVVVKGLIGKWRERETGRVRLAESEVDVAEKA
ncbi:hypothetical protein JCM21900_000477 [Sporobolomyces salmonicolor]